MRECLLPPVPLGLKSTSTFYVINNGYDNLELSDGDGLLLGRPAWVGGGMILLDHQAGG